MCVCFPEQRQTPQLVLHFPAASLFQSEAISEHIDVLSSCAAETLLILTLSHRLQVQILLIRALIDCNVAFEKHSLLWGGTTLTGFPAVPFLLSASGTSGVYGLATIGPYRRNH